MANDIHKDGDMGVLVHLDGKKTKVCWDDGKPYADYGYVVPDQIELVPVHPANQPEEAPA